MADRSLAVIISWTGALPVIVALAGAATVGFLLHRQWKYVRILLGALLLTILGVSVLKIAISRGRPTSGLLDPWDSRWSFPSGHAALAVAVYATLAYLVGRGRPNRVRGALALLAALMIVAIGWSRISLGLHYASDVLAGYAVGAIAVMIALVVER
jgi:undecaprenyl-diphosphatase